MNRSFIHRPLFRVFSPLFSGMIVYLLILLINNNVGALEELFAGRELYFCIGLSYLTHEFSRLMIVLLSKKGLLKPALTGVILTVLVCSVIVILLVTISLHVYFQLALGYAPILSELVIFNSIFIVISWIHISLFIAHDILRQSHALRIKQEVEIKQKLEEEFLQYKQGINPNLLFESLEQLLVLSRVDLTQAEEFLDHLAQVYRYVLARHQELVDVRSELKTLESLVSLFNALPNRDIRLHMQVRENFLVVPGTLLKVVETLVRMAIASPLNQLDITLRENGDSLEVTAEFLDRMLVSKNTGELLEQLNHSYRLYADTLISYTKDENIHYFILPKLTLHDESTDH